MDGVAVVVEPPERSEVVEIRTDGKPGPRGEQGIQGVAGQNATGAYLHAQNVASTIWVIDHHLGYDPAAIRVIDTLGDQYLAQDVVYTTPGQQLRLTFQSSIAGTARVS